MTQSRQLSKQILFISFLSQDQNLADWLNNAAAQERLKIRGKKAIKFGFYNVEQPVFHNSEIWMSKWYWPPRFKRM